MLLKFGAINSDQSLGFIWDGCQDSDKDTIKALLIVRCLLGCIPPLFRDNLRTELNLAPAPKKNLVTKLSSPSFVAQEILIAMSSLSAQLAARTTLDSSRLATVQSLKHPPSFIYTPRHAASLSITDLHHQATNAWEQLVLLDSRFSALTNKILGEEAKGTDRTNLTRDENEKLDKVLDKCLRLLGRFVLIKPAGVVIEWLIRRFR